MPVCERQLLMVLYDSDHSATPRVIEDHAAFADPSESCWSAGAGTPRLLSTPVVPCPAITIIHVLWITFTHYDLHVMWHAQSEDAVD